MKAGWCMQAADENIAHSTRSTDFIAPRSAAERGLRNAVLSLAPVAMFARPRDPKAE